MRRKRVLIVRTGSLLMDGVELLLRARLEAAIEIVSTAPRTAEALLREIARCDPSVVLMEDVTPFITPGYLLASLRSNKGIRVIALSSEVNKMDIYDRSMSDIYNKRELLAPDPAHFIAALASG